jgi:hypothetical protein
MSKINFQTFLEQETKKINFSIQEHHPYFHYEGANKSCPKCTESLETPQELYNRIFPIAEIDDKKIQMEVLEKEDGPIVEVKPEKETAKKSIKDFFQKKNLSWEEARKKKIEKSASLIKDVETANALKPKNLNKRNVLYLPYVGYTRSLSIIQCLVEMEKKTGKQLYELYDVISGSGDSAIIAACCALGKTAEEIKTFFINDWVKAYQANLIERSLRKVDDLNILTPKKYGFSSSKARSILKDFFKVSSSNGYIQNKFYDLKTEVYFLVIYSRFKESFAYTKATSENLPIVDALMDVCLNPFDFNQSETVKGKGIPMFVPDMELLVLQENKEVNLTKIDVPYLHKDHGSLNHAGLKELAPVIRDQSDFITKINIETHVKNFNSKRVKYECKPISNLIPKNSTSLTALNEAIEAGKTIQPLAIK